MLIYEILPKAEDAITTFYENVALRYRHTYSYANLVNNIQQAVSSIYRIERSLLRRQPTLSKWEGYYMAKADKWYFAYIIEGNKVFIVDACHSQNMHE